MIYNDRVLLRILTALYLVLLIPFISIAYKTAELKGLILSLWLAIGIASYVIVGVFLATRKSAAKSANLGNRLVIGCVDYGLFKAIMILLAIAYVIVSIEIYGFVDDIYPDNIKEEINSENTYVAIPHKQ